jgi:Rod binding domain-containing protein
MDNTVQIYNSISDGEILKNKLNETASVKDSGKPAKLTDADKAKLANAARGFESMFVDIMYKEMKKGMLGKDENKDNADSTMLSFGANTLDSVTDMAFSDEISKSGKGIGIAEMIYSNLTGGDSLKPITYEHVSEKPLINTQPALETKPAGNIIKDSKPTIFGSSFYERLNNRLDKYSGIITEASKTYKVPENIIKAVISAESAGRQNAVSSAGAKGLMQLMDGTADNLGVGNSFNPKENIFGGTKYLKQMLDRFDGNIDNALAAYNAGPGNVIKYSGVPPFKETQSYVVRVKKYIKMFATEI